jgi:hypothetical protein
MNPMSREDLLAQGSCCKNGCVNCPYSDKPINVKCESCGTVKGLGIAKDEPRDTYCISCGKCKRWNPTEEARTKWLSKQK